MTNPLFVFVAALIPLAMGFVWYHPKLFGTAWKKGIVGVPPEVLDKGPKPLMLAVGYLLSVMLAFVLFSVTVHQSGITSLFVGLEGFGDPASPVQQQYAALMEQFKTAHRHFGHGAMHGAIAGVFIALPVIATNGMFEFRTWKHNAINAGYWIVTMTLMGGIVCQFA